MNFRESIDAQNYNGRDSVPQIIMCQSQHVPIKPRNAEGVEWVEMHQKALGLTPDGKLGPKTMAALEDRYGSLDDQQHTVHPMPVWVSRWGYDHAHDYGHLDWPYHEPSWKRYTDDGSWNSAMLRLVSGFSPASLTFNRSPRSVISLDTLSIGFCHYWAKTMVKHVPAVCHVVPRLVCEAFPDPDHQDIVSDRIELTDMLQSTRTILVDGKWIDERYWRKGKDKFSSEHAWFVSGWRHLMMQPSAIEAHVKSWIQKYVYKGRALVIRYFGEQCLSREDGGRILAAVVRMVNSGPAERWIRKGVKEKSKRPMKALEYIYKLPRSDGGYGKPDRWSRIMSWDGFRGAV